MGERDEEFTAFVVARRDHLVRTAYLLCGDVGLAEDLVQVALTKVYLAWPRVVRMTAPEAYARRVLVTCHIDQTRRAWWSRERTGAALPDRAAPGGYPPEERDEVVAALGQLAPAMRRVVVLRHLWGLSIPETAEMLGVTQGTVKSQSAKALGRLSQLLSPLRDEIGSRT